VKDKAEKKEIEIMNMCRVEALKSFMFKIFNQVYEYHNMIDFHKPDFC